MLNNFKKSEKGSITVFVLSTMLVIVGVIFVLYFSMMNKASSQNEQLERIQEEYNQSNSAMEQTYNEELTFEPGMIADKNETYTDDNGDTATVPKGFEILEEADTIEDGLVIRDESGNEFVWIPIQTVVSDTEANGTNNKAMAIEQENNYRGLLYDFTSSGSTVINGCTTTTSNFREPDILSAYDNNTSNNNGLFTKASLQQDYNKMIKSVLQYHGFYIGRYELGLEGTVPVIKKASTDVKTADASNLYTYRWYGLYSKCKEFAPEDSDKSVVSSMIWGSQYDAMLNWMLGNEIDVSVIEGRVPDTEKNSTPETGSNSKDNLKNIFDLYGCHREWTLEASTANVRIIRGGYYYTSYPPSSRNQYTPLQDSGFYSSRITLYIK